VHLFVVTSKVFFPRERATTNLADPSIFVLLTMSGGMILSLEGLGAMGLLYIGTSKYHCFCGLRDSIALVGLSSCAVTMSCLAVATDVFFPRVSLTAQRAGPLLFANMRLAMSMSSMTVAEGLAAAVLLSMGTRISLPFHRRIPWVVERCLRLW
jgi:hypothetical protein